MQSVWLQGYLEVPLERLDEVRLALPDHIALTRAEPGCIAFDVHEDTATPGRFEVAERFVDQAAFDRHQARTRSSPWATLTAGMPRHYTITVGSGGA